MQFEKSSQTNSTPVFSLTKRQRSSNRKEGCKAFGLSGANDPVIKKVQMNGGGGGLCRRVSNAKRLFLLVSCRLERILRPPLLSPPSLVISFRKRTVENVPGSITLDGQRVFHVMKGSSLA